MSTVYAVSTGTYSDYSVRGIFSTKEKAEQFKAAFYDAEYTDIEEYPLDVGISELDKGKHLYRVRMSRSGTVQAVESSDLFGVGYVQDPVRWFDRTYKGPEEPFANFYVWAKSDTGAVKIANERRIVALAQELPPAA